MAEQAESLTMRVTSEQNGGAGRTVQVVIDGPDGQYKTTFDLEGDTPRWVSIPFKLKNGKVAIN